MKNKNVTLTIEDLTSGVVSNPVASTDNSGNTTVASGGVYSGQVHSSVYTLTSLNPTTYTLTADFGLDKDLSMSGVVSFSTPIAMGSAGLTATFTDVEGAGNLTAGDTWTINCAGATKIIDCKMNIVDTSGDGLNTKTEVFHPRRVSIPNATGKDLGFNVLSNDLELDEYIADSTNYDLIAIEDSTTLAFSDIYPLPTPEYLVMQNTEGGAPSATITVEMISYFSRTSR